MPFTVNGIEYDRKDPEQHKEYMREYLRQWRKDNPEKVKEYLRKSYHKIMSDPVRKAEKLNAYKEWRCAHADELRTKAKVHQREKYNSDPEYRQRRLDYMKNKYWSDEAYREKQKAYARNYVNKKSQSST